MKRNILVIMILCCALMIGCSVKEELNVSTNNSVAYKQTTIVPVSEVNENETLTINGKDIRKYPIKKVNGQDCYVAEEKSTYTHSKFTKERFTQQDGTQIGILNKNEFYTDNKEIAQYTASGMVLTTEITFPYKIVKSNGALSNNGKTVLFKNDKNLIYAITEKSSLAKAKNIGNVLASKIATLKKNTAPKKITYKVKASKKLYTVKKGKKVSGKILVKASNKTKYVTGKIKSIKSSNKKIATVTLNKSTTKFTIKGKKTGKCYLTIKSKVGKTVKVNVKVIRK